MNKELIDGKLYEVAIHEAAHFVLGAVGYSWAGESTSRGSMPECVSIVGDEINAGYVRDYADLIFLTPHLCPPHLRAKQVIDLLAGHATEAAYGLTNRFTNEGFGGDAWNEFDSAEYMHPGEDFFKATSLLKTLTNDEENAYEQMLYMGVDYWNFTVSLLKTPAMRSAIEFVANELLTHKEISRPEIFDLADSVFALPDFKDFCLQIPDIKPVKFRKRRTSTK